MRLNTNNRINRLATMLKFTNIDFSTFLPNLDNVKSQNIFSLKSSIWIFTSLSLIMRRFRAVYWHRYMSEYPWVRQMFLMLAHLFNNFYHIILSYYRYYSYSTYCSLIFGSFYSSVHFFFILVGPLSLIFLFYSLSLFGMKLAHYLKWNF